MSNIKLIEGKTYDGDLIDLARELTTGRGEGQISKDEAAQLFDKVRDGNAYTEIEKATVEYLRANFKWTDAADEWFRAEVRKWAATK